MRSWILVFSCPVWPGPRCRTCLLPASAGFKCCAAARESGRKPGGLLPGAREFIAVDDALNPLEELDPRKACVIELSFFAGSSVGETAEVLKVFQDTCGTGDLPGHKDISGPIHKVIEYDDDIVRRGAKMGMSSSENIAHQRQPAVPARMLVRGRPLREILESHKAWIENRGGARADLGGAVLGDADLRKADLRKAILTGASFLEANLSEADLSGADLIKADFRGATLVGADLTGALLTQTDFQRSWLAEANLSEAQIEHARFRAANMRDCRMLEARLQDSDFSGANLNAVLLNHAYAFGCNFTEADLSKAKFLNSRIQMCRLMAAKLNQANFTLAQLQNCNLRETDARSAKFIEANLSQSDFFGSQLTNCDFSGSNLSSADFTNADLSESLFGSAKLTATDFRYTVLRGARELTGLQLSGARTTQDTILPNGSKGPFVRGFGAEYPARR